MEDERFYWLINRTNAGDINDHEFNELLSLVAEKPELRPLYELLTAKPNAGGPAEYEEAMKAYTAHYARMQLSGHLEHIPTDQSTLEIKESKGKGIFKMWILKTVAASVLLGFFVFLFISKQGENTQLVFISKKGTKNKMILPDGTKVWLNADSKLTLAKQFTGPTREVRLSGEAYFEVAHDKSHPFVISANAIKVKVLGTVFNLKAYPDDEDTETTLIQGQVEVSIDGQSSSRISLKPGEKLKVHNEKSTSANATKQRVKPTILLTKTSVAIKDNQASESLWTEDKLVFDAEPFENVAAKLGRWYNKNIIIEDEALKQANFTATFEEKTLKEVLLALQYTTKFSYRIEENVVYIQRDK